MWLLIGGSGFIGTNFAKFLLENDYQFRIYDIKRSRYLPESVETIVGDIRDKTKLSKAMNGCDVVFHLATVPPSLRIPKKEIHDIDVNGMKNVLYCAEKNHVRRLIFTSSASHVYGLVEEGSCPLKEDTYLNPVNDYGRDKVITEELLNKTSGMKTVILRLSMVLGPYNFDPILIENVKAFYNNKKVVIPGDGSSKMHSIHVEDVVSALLASAQNPSLPEHSVFNIAGNEILSLNEWLELLRTLMNSRSKVSRMPVSLARGLVRIAWTLHKSKIHPSYLSLMDQDQYFDISKAREVLRWEPIHSVEESLVDSIDFIREECL